MLLGVMLDLMGTEVNVARVPHETDASLRDRILAAAQRKPLPEPRLNLWGRILRFFRSRS